MGRWSRVPRDISLRRRSDFAFLRDRNHRPDVPITAAGQGLDPTAAVWGNAENPAERRDLNGEVVFLNYLARPSSLNQHILRNQFAGPLNQCPQQDNRALPEAHGLGSAQQQVVPRIQAKRPEHKACHSSRILGSI
jgi:hypothetical protein